MAEFTEVMRHAKRMCDAIVSARCHECTLWRPETESCSLYGDDDGVDYADIERRVMAWAAEHPEPVYPSWREAWQSLFQGGENPCPEQWFCEDCPKDMECFDCIERPMSKKVAEKLGIKPITTEKVVPEHDGCEGCRWMDKREDEKPCKNCRGASDRPAPDLWEER